MPGEVEHGNGTQRADGIALTGAVTFDQDLYGGDDRAGYVGSIGVADDEQQDERERALARCGGRPLFGPRRAAVFPSLLGLLAGVAR